MTERIKLKPIALNPDYRIKFTLFSKQSSYLPQKEYDLRRGVNELDDNHQHKSPTDKLCHRCSDQRKQHAVEEHSFRDSWGLLFQ